MSKLRLRPKINIDKKKILYIIFTCIIILGLEYLKRNNLMMARVKADI